MCCINLRGRASLNKALSAHDDDEPVHDTSHTRVADGDGDQADGGEHVAQAVGGVAPARGLPAAEGRGGPAAAPVPRPGAPARAARGGGQPRHARVGAARHTPHTPASHYMGITESEPSIFSRGVMDINCGYGLNTDLGMIIISDTSMKLFRIIRFG